MLWRNWNNLWSSLGGKLRTDFNKQSVFSGTFNLFFIYYLLSGFQVTFNNFSVSSFKMPLFFLQNSCETNLLAFQNDVVREVKNWWNNLTSGERLFVPICGLNILVFLAWRVPPLQGFMMKYFCSNPASSKVCLPMVLSTFSHYSGLHLLANMYVLHSFSTGDDIEMHLSIWHLVW